MSKRDTNSPVNTVGYDDPIAWREMVRAAFSHGDTISPEEMEQRRRRRCHHTVPVYLLRLFQEGTERLFAFDRETKRAFVSGPRGLFCENGANIVLGEDGKLRSDVEGVFAYTDAMISKTVKQIVKVMRRCRTQLIENPRTPVPIDLTLVEANQWEGDAVALWCSQRKRNPQNLDFKSLDLRKLCGAWETMTETARKMLFNVWRVTLDQGAISELMEERELTVGVAVRQGFVVGDELANFVDSIDTRSGSDRVPVIPIARDVCLLWRR